MKFEKTKFPYFYSECIKILGNKKGEKLFEGATEILEELVTNADYRNSEVVKGHMTGNTLPIISIYKACLVQNMLQAEAYDFTLGISQIRAKQESEQNKKLGSNPLGYFMFKLFCKKVIRKNFPELGWKIEWIKCNKKEIHFNMKSCIYAEITKQYGCPELCPVFCANDITAFSGYKPNIVFEREATIGEGKEICDFHFKNGKYY